ncbi:PAS domain S-box protein [Halosimplex salinum]|uniref:PAS domain S-box protein n=1 Tax=Halosimplex salinum TaxID=1710538 RepID=UPI000F4A0C5A|nr:PAS domain S-box protein [Halosimplex salinum]
MAAWHRFISVVGGRRLIALLGGLYVAAGIGWTLAEMFETTTISELIIFVLIAGPGAVLLYSGYRLARFDIHTEFYPSVASWCVGGLGVMVAVLGFYSLQPNEGIEDVSTVLILTGLAAVAGLAAGIHNAQAGTRARELEATIDQLERSNERFERYAMIVEAVDDGVYVADDEGTFQMVNETYAEMLGYSPDDLVGTDSSRLLDDEIADQIDELYRETGDEYADRPTVETRLRTASGEWLPVEATPALLPEDDESDWHRAGIVRDISDRKERERALEKSEQRYRALVENFPNGAVGLFDDDLRYTVVGGQMFDSLDYDPEDRIGHSFTELHPSAFVDELEPYFYAALEGETSSFEVEFQNRKLYATTLPIEDDYGDVFAGMIMIQDVTERRRYERMLEESNERLEQFAYAASHDLQEPLRMVSSYLQLIDQRYGDDLDEDGQEFLEFAVDGADRMREMIEGLLQYSRVDTSGDSLEPVDLESVLADVRDDLQVKIEESGAEITADPLPSVEGDGGQLRQLFQNLLENAIEYSGDDPPTVHIATERNGDRWQISVRDEGIGIDPDDRERVFEVFQSLRIDDGDHSGTGIGLALCERIVERHGGDIWIDGDPGEGTTFSFTLLAADDASD